ncbi:NADH dehydrogenase [ubiquinone] 1 alpha subcomplex subunit 7-like [Saccostrea echinata]|uniref:NADH dehydrogenase [ubiquinone] 1 alpha subcomplex subunit 7-like n=1 Tax=Saccostrea echinata TaxID=191078 RepID=UPI002A80C9A5|nr:NADH dehydrogenase [ubiquinone] 1 alpha subcomplex subunit 7-like [Saccostrea echinata]
MAKRDIIGFLQSVRAGLLNIKHPDNYLRFQVGKEVAARTQPAPNLPDGPSHKLSANYYLERDARRLVEPPEEILSGGQKLLPDTAASEGKGPQSPGYRAITPGNPYNPKSIQLPY